MKYDFCLDDREYDFNSALHDCRLVFESITDDESFQEADTGLLFSFANSIEKALEIAAKLPKKHGRLVDAEDVKENHQRWLGYIDQDMINRLNMAIDRHIPTILEKENLFAVEKSEEYLRDALKLIKEGSIEQAVEQAKKFLEIASEVAE